MLAQTMIHNPKQYKYIWVKNLKRPEISFESREVKAAVMEPTARCGSCVPSHGRQGFCLITKRLITNCHLQNVNYLFLSIQKVCMRSSNY